MSANLSHRARLDTYFKWLLAEGRAKPVRQPLSKNIRGPISWTVKYDPRILGLFPRIAFLPSMC